MASKRLKEVENDMISTLPDPILCHILSFLPTRTSVAKMSLVSRRWRHLWKHLDAFHFDDSDWNGEFRKLFKRFAFFANAVLSLRKSRNIRKFHLSCTISDFYKFSGDCIDVWLDAALGPHLEELDLTIDNAYGTRLCLLPRSFFNCTNLVSLSLLGSIHMRIHSSVHFPSLKKLKIDPGIMELDTDIVQNEIDIMDPLVPFLSGCPVLQTIDTYFDSSFLTKVPVPSSSKRLKSSQRSFSWTCLEIDSDWLKPMGIGGIAKTTLGIIGNFQNVEEAYLDVFSLRPSDFVDPILCLLHHQNGDLHLLFRHSTSKRPLCNPVLNYPEFCNLNHLKFILPCFNNNLMLNVLVKCHVLQVLIIQCSKEEQPPFGSWELESTTVPKCLKSHLTYIHIEGYQGFEDELAFAEYILHNGQILDTMLISFDTSMDLTNKYCSRKRLTDIPRGSVTCQLKFDPNVSP
ncbi:FBD-associated F-box protein At4g10400-like [Vicia villosa]|uniref:FBD-associated F-box protein At4g10400-like n=1 Tax=Vicia villosa TaxID=3911 RepID=UPI00273B280E|nr:FBD-associated F-box protein At4g10400-like [Vicia villosa]